MKRLIFSLTILLASCAPAAVTVSPTDSATRIFSTPAAPEIRIPAMDSTWHIQYTGDIDLGLEVDLYNLDLFDTDPSSIAGLHGRGVYVMCYFSAGSFEDWRPDANQFPAQTLGHEMEGWPGEKWLDIRQISLLAPVMEARLDLAREKGCDGVDPDNINAYTNETGFPLTYEDQLQFNIWLANAAHSRGLAIGLKNDIEQILELMSHFDWQLNEQCFYYNECEFLLPFIEAGKPVFNIEYELAINEFCRESNLMGFNSIRKNLSLDKYSEYCK